MGIRRTTYTGKKQNVRPMQARLTNRPVVEGDEDVHPTTVSPGLTFLACKQSRRVEQHVYRAIAKTGTVDYRACR